MTTILCIGDSLTEGADIPEGHAWTDLAANALKVDIVNAGIGGDTSAGMLARFFCLADGRRPGFVFILGGTNDLWWGWEINTVLGHLFSMAVQARHLGIAPLIGLPLPVDVAAASAADFDPPLEGYARFNEKMKALVEALIVHARASEVAVVDLYHPFLTEPRMIRSDLFLPDGLHPNLAGHRAIADAVVHAFNHGFDFSASSS